jgi:hypothetical protein
MGTPSSSSRDTKIYTVCDPYTTERSARRGSESFLNGISSKSDDYANLRDHLEFSSRVFGCWRSDSADSGPACSQPGAHGHVPRALAVRQRRCRCSSRRMATLLERRRGRLVTGKGCKGVIEYMYQPL